MKPLPEMYAAAYGVLMVLSSVLIWIIAMFAAM